MNTTIFINYRQADTSGWARLLFVTLAERFGAENVFLDQVSLGPGMKWLRAIRTQSGSATAFIALIGPKWASIISERAGGSEEDFVRTEIEAALRRGSGVQEVIPALVQDAVIPGKEELRNLGTVPKLFERQQIELRPAHWDADVEALIERLSRMEENAEVESPDRSTVKTEAPAGTTKVETESEVETESDSPPHPVAPPPDRDHYDQLVRLMLEEGSLVVPFLGPGANSSDRTEPWRDVDSEYLPDSDELAAYLADTLGTAGIATDLAEVSQSISVTQGPSALYRALKKALPSHQPPGSVHNFLARFPTVANELGSPDRYQLIVTTNYDDALERAFGEAEEPYDLAVYLDNELEKGKFVHVPFNSEPKVIVDANGYDGFPIDALGGVERTVIMKIHGGVEGPRGPYPWPDNYVITEDDYIGYMSVGDIETIVPQQLLGKLRTSHLLFLGHAMRNWNLRVFMIKVFGPQLQNASWAIQRDPNRLDDQFWHKLGIHLAAISLDEYVAQLGEHLPRVAGVEGTQG